MPKRLSTEDHLATLRTLRVESSADRRTAGLMQLLSSPNLHGIVLKGAARLAMETGARETAALLNSAAEALMGETGAKRDPGCEGKIAAAQALVEWEANLPAFFLKMAVYRQMEATFGKTVDTAPECRGLAAIAIARLRPEGAVFLLTDLLADEAKATRVQAAIALRLWRGPEAAPVLRLKAHVGDEDAEVMAEVLAGLLAHGPREHWELVCSFLNRSLTLVEAAAIALGQSRMDAAFQPLIDAWARYRRTPVASTLLMAIALLRTEESQDWLLKTVRQVGPSEGAMILDALRIYRGDERMKSRVRTVVEGSDELRQVFEEVFGA